ncbi:MAG: hypothetical protein LBO66_07665 [Deltaproteobacteria bacterium]|nr:hypothetical protein [Deltaproteobacteria bacterium]
MAEAVKEFVTWRDIYNQLKQDLTRSDFRTMQQYSITAGGTGGSRMVSYRDLNQLKQLIALAKEEMDAEEPRDWAARTYPRNGGRG